MGIPERRERERQELRQKILDAARELFAARGYEAVTMREIARRIEYSATALYQHFTDKEALVRELCMHDFEVLVRRFVEVASGSSEPFERLTRVGLVYLDFAARFPQHYRLMFMGGLPPITPGAEERNDPTHNAYLFLRALVSDLIHAQVLRPELTDIDLVAQTTWGAVHGAAALELTLPHNESWLDFRPRQQRFKAVLELLGRSLTRDPEAAQRTLERVLREDADKPWGLGEPKPARGA